MNYYSALKSPDSQLDQTQQYSKKTIPLSNYSCKKCGMRGHWSENCPTESDPRSPSDTYYSETSPKEFINQSNNIVTISKISYDPITQTTKEESVTVPWTQISNDEEYDSEAINNLYDTLLKESLKAYSESTQNKTPVQYPQLDEIDFSRPFNHVNNNIITKILNYLDLYSVIYFTQTCKKVATAFQSPYTLTSSLPALTAQEETIISPLTITTRDDKKDAETDEEKAEEDGVLNNSEELFSILEPIDLTKIKFVNPKTKTTIFPFAHLEINENTQLDVNDFNKIINSCTSADGKTRFNFDDKTVRNATNDVKSPGTNQTPYTPLPYLDLNSPNYSEYSVKSTSIGNNIYNSSDSYGYNYGIKQSVDGRLDVPNMINDVNVHSGLFTDIQFRMSRSN